MTGVQTCALPIFSLLGDSMYNLLISVNSVYNTGRRKLGWGYWSLSKWIKGKTKQAVNFIYKFESHLANYAQQCGAQGVICGHIHTPTIKQIEGTIYANTGDWVENCSALVETIEGEFQLLVLDRHNIMQVVHTWQ